MYSKSHICSIIQLPLKIDGRGFWLIDGRGFSYDNIVGEFK